MRHACMNAVGSQENNPLAPSQEKREPRDLAISAIKERYSPGKKITNAPRVFSLKADEEEC